MPDWIIGVTAAAWGFVMALAPVLQIIRMLRRRSSEDVSVGYFCLLVPGFLLWVGYGLSIDDVFLALPNALAAVTGACLIAVAVRLRRDAATRPAPP